MYIHTYVNHDIGSNNFQNIHLTFLINLNPKASFWYNFYNIIIFFTAKLNLLQ